MVATQFYSCCFLGWPPNSITIFFLGGHLIQTCLFNFFQNIFLMVLQSSNRCFWIFFNVCCSIVGIFSLYYICGPFPFFDLVNPMQLADFKNINEAVGNDVENFDLWSFFFFVHILMFKTWFFPFWKVGWNLVCQVRRLIEKPRLNVLLLTNMLILSRALMSH